MRIALLKRLDPDGGRRLSIAIWVLFSPIIGTLGWLMIYLVTVVSCCEYIYHSELSDAERLYQIHVEAQVLKNFYKYDYRGYCDVSPKSRMIMNSLNRKGIKYHVAQYGKWHVADNFEIFYAPEGRVIRVVRVYPWDILFE